MNCSPKRPKFSHILSSKPEVLSTTKNKLFVSCLRTSGKGEMKTSLKAEIFPDRVCKKAISRLEAM
jgi:hypothetical protein